MALTDFVATQPARRSAAGPTVAVGRDTLNARHWIAGAWQNSVRALHSVNPATGEVIGTFADAGADEANAAIAAARVAFDTTGWARNPMARSQAITELADNLHERRDAIAQMLSRENGKRVAETAWEVAGAVAYLRHSAAIALTGLSGHALTMPDGTSVTSLREPRGVAGVISPWNSPVILTARALGPALAAGCTVVAKMPGHTGLTNGLFAEAIAATVGFPAGVVNTFTEQHGDGARRLVASPDVDVIAFTGSTATGLAIAAECARQLKPVSLELGGKTPLLLFEDTDVAAALPTVLQALLLMNGQFCCTGSRLLVHRSIAGQVRDALVAALGSVRIAPPDDPTSQLGPVINRESVARLDQFVEEAEAYATVLVRGGPINAGPLSAGSYFRPALLEVTTPDVAAVQHELFGPVLTFEVFDDEADAVRRANATTYGLAASVFTADRARMRRVGRALRAGGVWCNTWGTLPNEFPTSGYKQSGLGASGPTAVEEFLQTKVYAEVA